MDTMKKLIAVCARFATETEGQDLIEYALLAGTLALGALVAMQGVKTAIINEFTTIDNLLTAGS